MATREQCGKRLRKRLRTKQDVVEFCFGKGGAGGGWGGKVVNVDFWDDHTFVEKNIQHIVEQAHRKELLDQLGIKLGFPSDAEAERCRITWAIGRSWLAFIISLLALGASAWGLYQ